MAIQAARAARLVPAIETDVAHPITQIRRARFSAERAYKSLNEALLLEQAEPVGRLRYALEELNRARDAVQELLR